METTMIKRKKPNFVELVIEKEGKVLICSIFEKLNSAISQRIGLTDNEKEAMQGILEACAPKRKVTGGIVFEVGAIEPIIPSETVANLSSLLKKIDPSAETNMQLAERERKCLMEFRQALM